MFWPMAMISKATARAVLWDGPLTRCVDGHSSALGCPFVAWLHLGRGRIVFAIPCLRRECQLIIICSSICSSPHGDVIIMAGVGCDRRAEISGPTMGIANVASSVSQAAMLMLFSATHTRTGLSRGIDILICSATCSGPVPFSSACAVIVASLRRSSPVSETDRNTAKSPRTSSPVTPAPVSVGSVTTVRQLGHSTLIRPRGTVISSP